MKDGRACKVAGFENMSCQRFKGRLYGLQSFAGKYKIFWSFSEDLKDCKKIFETDKNLSIVFRVIDEETFLFIDQTDNILLRYEKYNFKILKKDLSPIMEDNLKVSDNFIGLITYEIDKKLLGGFGGTINSLHVSTDRGDSFEKVIFHKKQFIRPYAFYEDYFFIGNLTKGKLIYVRFDSDNSY